MPSARLSGKKKTVLNDKKNLAPQNKSLLCNIVYYFCSMVLEDFWWISHPQFWIYSIRALVNEGKWNKLQYNITYFGLKTFLNMIQLKNLTPKTHKFRHDCFFDKTSKLNYWVFSLWRWWWWIWCWACKCRFFCVFLVFSENRMRYRHF